MRRNRHAHACLHLALFSLLVPPSSFGFLFPVAHAWMLTAMLLSELLFFFESRRDDQGGAMLNKAELSQRSKLALREDEKNGFVAKASRLACAHFSFKLLAEIH